MLKKIQTTLIIAITITTVAMLVTVAPTAQQLTPPRNRTEASTANQVKEMNQAMLPQASLVFQYLLTRSKGTACLEAYVNKAFLNLEEVDHGRTWVTWSMASKTCF